MGKTYFVYILASNKKDGALYIGVTNDLIRRINEHKTQYNEGFSKSYNTHRLVHYEETDDIAVAIEREKQLKKWNRRWKVRLIENDNPEWDDLYESIIEES